MSYFEFSSSDIQALAKLLAPPESEADADVVRTREISKPSPASIGPRDLLPVKVAPPRAHGRGAAVKTDALCLLDEDEALDGRETPEYDFRYKQSVTTSDNFLGMSGKDPSSICCEQLVLVVQLPQTTAAAELELDTAPTSLRLVSPKYKLQLCLPHRVDSERGTAKWDPKKKTLSICLPIIRDDPFRAGGKSTT